MLIWLSSIKSVDRLPTNWAILACVKQEHLIRSQSAKRHLANANGAYLAARRSALSVLLNAERPGMRLILSLIVVPTMLREGRSRLEEKKGKQAGGFNIFVDIFGRSDAGYVTL